jgi:hypothetical protein
MTEQGEIVKKPGQNMTTSGLIVLVLGLALLMYNLFTTVTKYVPGVGTVEVKGTPSAGAIILIIVGLLLAGIGFARRLLAAAENR